MSFDTTGHDHAVVTVMVGTHATNGASIGTMKFSESDSATSPTSMTDIVALTGGTATSTSVGFVINDASELGPGAIIEFDIDLRRYKKYMSLSITPGTTTMQIAALGQLVRSKESADTAAEKSDPTLYTLTSATACAQVVTA
jgi:hypothetical protein